MVYILCISWDWGDRIISPVLVKSHRRLWLKYAGVKPEQITETETKRELCILYSTTLYTWKPIFNTGCIRFPTVPVNSTFLGIGIIATYRRISSSTCTWEQSHSNRYCGFSQNSSENIQQFINFNPFRHCDVYVRHGTAWSLFHLFACRLFGESYGQLNSLGRNSCKILNKTQRQFLSNDAFGNVFCNISTILCRSPCVHIVLLWMGHHVTNYGVIDTLNNKIIRYSARFM